MLEGALDAAEGCGAAEGTDESDGGAERTGSGACIDGAGGGEGAIHAGTTHATITVAAPIPAPRAAPGSHERLAPTAAAEA